MAFSAQTSKNPFNITPSDTTEQPASAIYVGGAGNIAIETIRGESITFTNYPAGQILPVSCSKVLSTGTTASGLVGLRD